MALLLLERPREDVRRPEEATRPTSTRTRWYGPYELIFLAAAAMFILWQVLGTPVRGLANQGDYERLLVPMRIAPVASQPYSPYNLTTLYRTNGTPGQLGVTPSFFQTPAVHDFYCCYHSSQTVLIRTAVDLHSLLSSGYFDIRWMGVVNAIAWILGLAALVAATRALPRRARFVAVALLALAFSDPGYILYLNSFYSEPAEIAFLLMAFGCAVCTTMARRPWLPFAGFVIAGAMAAGAKPEDLPIAIILLLLGLALAVRCLGGWQTVAAFGGSIGIGLSGLWSWLSLEPYYGRYVLYQSVFDGILRVSKPTTALASLGLPANLARYAGTDASASNSGLTAPAVQPLYTHVSTGNVIGFYVTHPGALGSIAQQTSKSAFSLRPGLGNLAFGNPPNSQFLPNSPWTLVHRILPDALWFIVIVLLMAIVMGAVALWRLYRATADQEKTGFAPEVLIAIALTAAVAFIEVPIGDGLVGVTKHMAAFNALFDLVLILLVALAANWLASSAARVVRSFPLVAAQPSREEMTRRMTEPPPTIPPYSEPPETHPPAPDTIQQGAPASDRRALRPSEPDQRESRSSKPDWTASDWFGSDPLDPISTVPVRMEPGRTEAMPADDIAAEQPAVEADEGVAKDVPGEPAEGVAKDVAATEAVAVEQPAAEPDGRAAVDLALEPDGSANSDLAVEPLDSAPTMIRPYIPSFGNRRPIRRNGRGRPYIPSFGNRRPRAWQTEQQATSGTLGGDEADGLGG